MLVRAISSSVMSPISLMPSVKEALALALKCSMKARLSRHTLYRYPNSGPA